MQEDLDNKWVCPSDRHLSLRAKLNCGWSVRASFSDPQHRMLSEDELVHIRHVISRAKAMESNEQIRVGDMIGRLELMQGRCCGNGQTNCVLCGEKFGKFVGESPVKCVDCKNKVCSKCSVTANSPTVNRALINDKPTHWLCKICSESREVWKRSGAWFFRSLPKYVHSKLQNKTSSNYSRFQPTFATSNIPASMNSINGMFDHRESICVGHKRSSSSESSDDEVMSRTQSRRTISSGTSRSKGKPIPGSSF